jgi:CRISPR/Cas system CSM-associated protein Csm3 (group 7 of RAMP superfamily)
MPPWTYQLAFNTPLSICSGLSVAGLVDRIIMRDGQGLPVVPGSTVKGRWRFAAERLLRSLPKATAGIHIVIHDKNKPACKDRKKACFICKWFGSPAIPAALQVGPATLDYPWCDIFLKLHAVSPSAVVQPDTEVRPGIAMSRRLRMALHDHLFFEETVPPVTFVGHVRLTEEPNAQEKAFLKTAAQLVDRLGANKAGGRGILESGIQIGDAK